MLIIDWDNFINNESTLKNNLAWTRQALSMTVGVFDGVHRGHKALIERIVSQGEVPAVVTFREPRHKEEKSIQTFKEKAAALKALGVEVLIVIDFDETFSRMSGIVFLETLLAHANIRFFAVGAKFHCGYGLDTDSAAIKEFFAAKGIAVEIVDEVLHNGEPISSSRIRAALAAGDLELATGLLGNTGH